MTPSRAPWVLVLLPLLGSAQGPAAPTILTAVAGDTSIAVTWTPNDNGTATSYVVQASVVYPYPAWPPPSTTVLDTDQFQGTSVNPAYWGQVLTSTCQQQPGSLSYPCYSAAPAVSESPGALNISVPGYSQLTLTDTIAGPPASVLSDWGWGGAAIVGYTGPYMSSLGAGTNPLAAGPNVVFQARLGALGSASSIYTFAGGGLVVYDLATNSGNPAGGNVPRWLLRFMYTQTTAGPSSASISVYYPSSLATVTTTTPPTQNIQTGSATIATGTIVLPVDLYLIRYPSPSMATAPLGGSWGFGYRGATDAAITWSSVVVADSSLYSFAGFAQGLDATRFTVGLHASSSYSYNAFATFSQFNVLSKASLDAAAGWSAYWGARNASLASQGVCATSHNVVRSFVAGTVAATVHGLVNNAPYSVTVSAMGAGGSSPLPGAWGSTLTPAVTLPVPGASLFLDANSLTPSISGGAYASKPVAAWGDSSGKLSNAASAFAQSATARQPTLNPRTLAKPFQSVSFAGAQDLEWNGDQTQFYLSASSATNFSDHPLTLFLMYQPRSPTASYTFSAVLSNGLYSTTDSGYHYYSYAGYYITNTPADYYPFSYGFRIGTSASNAASMGAQWGLANPTGVVSPHPHSASPTLLTFAYRPYTTNATGVYFELDACTGLNTGSAADACSKPAPGVAPVSSPWTTTVYEQNSGARGYTPTNVVLYVTPTPGFLPAMRQAFTLGAMAYGTSTITDRYVGDVHALAFYKGSMVQSDMEKVQGFLASRYGQQCPAPMDGPGAVPSGCAASMAGQICSQSCDGLGAYNPNGTLYSIVGGASSLTCSSGAWIGKSVVCGPQCPTLNTPAAANSCSKVFVSEGFAEFASGTVFSSLPAWDSAPQIPFPLADSFWSVVDGQLVASNPAASDPCNVLQPAGLFLSSPAWVAAMALTDPLAVSAQVMPASGGRAGLLFRVFSNTTYYRFSVTGDACVATLEYVANNVVTPRPLWTQPPVSVCTPSGLPALLSISVVANSAVDLTAVIVASVNNVTVFNVTDISIPSGSVGVWADSGGATFDNFVVSGVCDAGGAACRGMTTAQQCSYTCPAGFQGLGSPAQVCGANGAYLGTPFQCVPLPPVFTNVNASSKPWNVTDTWAAGTTLGTLTSVPASASQAVLYYIAPAANVETVRDIFGNVLSANVSGVFSVNLCSGVVRLNLAGVLNGRTGTKQFHLTVSSCANGNPLSCVNGTLVINVVAGPKPPVWGPDPVSNNTGTWIRYVLENSPVGTQIPPPMAAYSQNGNANVYSLDYGNSLGLFALAAATGNLSVAKAALNYEASPSYNLIVTAHDALNTSLATSIQVTVQLLPGNDPPVTPTVQYLEVNEAAVLAGGAIGTVAATDEDGMGTPFNASAFKIANVTFLGAPTTSLIQLDAPALPYQPQPGLLEWKSPLPFNFSALPIVSVDSRLVRGGVVVAAVNVTDYAGARAFANVRIYVMANVPSPVNNPIISGVAFPFGGTALSVGGGTVFSLLGSYFSSITTPPVANYYAPAGSAFPANYTTAPCSVVTAQEMRCTAPPGYGASLAVDVYATFNGGGLAKVPTSAVLSISYAPPVVTGVGGYTAPGGATSNPGALATPGGGLFWVYGTGLWSPDAAAVPAALLVTYGPWAASLAAVAGASNSATAILVSAAEGYSTIAGGSPVGVTLGGQPSTQAPSVPNATVTVDYAGPVLTSVAPGPGAAYALSNLSTAGGQTYVVTGQNLGPANLPAAALIARYGSYAPRPIPVDNATVLYVVLYRAPACVKDAASPHTRMTCTTAPGVGGGLSHAVTIGTAPEAILNASSFALSYARPVIASVSGAGAAGGSTAGGQQVVITGANLGPASSSLGDAAGGATLRSAVFSALYSSPRATYILSGCRVTADTPVNTVTCATGPGLGRGLDLSLSVAGQAGPGGFAPAAISYGAPVVIEYERPDGEGGTLPVDQFLTLGGEPVRILGDNFGPWVDPSQFSASYATTLRGVVNQYGQLLTPNATGGAVTFAVPAAACVMEVPHTQLLCSTSPGAGQGLAWTFTIGGQASVTPTTSFAPPVVSAIGLIQGPDPQGSVGIPFASTEGNDTALLFGANFGPATACAPRADGVVRCYGFVQAVTYGPTGREFTPRDFSVQSDGLMSVILTPGFGAACVFLITVAGQTTAAAAPGGPAVPSFAFSPPEVASLAPASGPTTGSGLVTITGRNWALLDARASLGIAFGNPSDGSWSGALLPALSLSPSPSSPAALAAFAALPASARISTAVFAVPPGALPMRAVRMVIFPTGSTNAALFSFSNASADADLAAAAGGAATAAPTEYSFLLPTLAAVTLQSQVSFLLAYSPSLVAHNTSSLPAAVAAAFPDPALAATVQVLTLQGSNFGQPLSALTPDAIARLVEADLIGDGNWSAAGVAVFSWDHTRIVALTTAASGSVRVHLSGRAFDVASPAVTSAAPIDVFSGELAYSNESPTVVGLDGSPASGYTTTGGDVIVFLVKHLASVTQGVTAAVGGRPCTLVDAAGDAISNTVALIQTPAGPTNPDRIPGATDADTQWRLRCILPPGEGANQPVVVFRDGDPSPDGVSVSYLPPRVQSFSVWDYTLGAWGPSVPYSLGQPGGHTVIAWTNGSRIRIDGQNFGVCPLFQGFGAPLALASPAACLNRTGLAYYVPGSDGLPAAASHTELIFTTDEGQGLGEPLIVAQVNQGLTSNASGAPPPTPMTLAYAPPTVTAVTQGGSTLGGDTISVQGTGFGPAWAAPQPIVTLGGLAAPCALVNRSSHWLLTCVLPVGAGAGLRVDVQVGGLHTAASVGFSYTPPNVTAVVLGPAPGPSGGGGGSGNATNATAAGARRMQVGGGAATSWTPASGADLSGPAAGNYTVTLLGTNFGPYDNASSCVFVAWRGRALGAPFACDGRLGFVGEGEVPGLPWALLAWGQTSITFLMPPGTGAKQLIPFAGGQPPLQPVPFAYAPPFIASALAYFPATATVPASTGPFVGGTDGGQPLLLQGVNFGIPGVYPSPAQSVASLLGGSLPGNVAAYLSAPPLPQAATTLYFFHSCSSPFLTAAGSRPPALASCAATAFLQQTDALLQFLSSPGIGVNRSVYLVVSDVDTDGSALAFPSNTVAFSYLPPLATEVRPSPVLMDQDPRGYPLTLLGSNFGRAPAPGSGGEAWTPEELEVAVTVGGVPCASAARGLLGSPPVDVLTCTLPETTVGFKNLSYTVAGQGGFTSQNAAAAAFAACGPGYYGYPGETCLQCPWALSIPPGALCDGFNASLGPGGTHTYPRPLPGFFNLNSSDLFTSGRGPLGASDPAIAASGAMLAACPSTMAVPGRDVCIVPCDPPGSCIGDNYCGTGYASDASAGWRCSSCAQGYYTRSNACVKCPDSPYAVVIGFAFVVAVLAAGAYILNKKKINIAFMSIAVDFFQVLAIFAASKITWPAPVMQLFSIMSAFNLNIEIVAPECLVPNVSYVQKWAFIMALPICVGGLFALISLCSILYKARFKGRKVAIGTEGAAFLSSLMLLFYILYIYLVRTILDVFNCTPTNPDDGHLYMSAVFVECGVPGGVQMTLVPWAIVAIVFYVLGYPFTAAYCLWTNRELIMEDQLLRAKGTGDDRLSNPHAYTVRKRFSRIYYQFKPDYFLWLLVIIARKFCIAATYILFNKNPAFQLAMCLLVLFLCYAAQTRANPYMGPSNFDAVIASHVQSAYTSPIHARLRATIAGIESRGRKRARRNLLTREGRVDAQALLGLLGSWIFDYNTVEAYMLFSASIVCLMGIMYAAQSSGSSFYSSSLDAITGVLLTVCALSITYLVGVIVTEVYILYSEASRRAALLRKSQQAKKVPEAGGVAAAAESRRRLKLAASGRDKFDAGDVDNALNPMFLTSSGGGGALGNVTTDPEAAAEAIRAMGGPPATLELWAVYKDTFMQLSARAEDLRTQASSFPEDVRAFMAAEAKRGASGQRIIIPQPQPGKLTPSRDSTNSFFSASASPSPVNAAGPRAPDGFLVLRPDAPAVGAAEAAVLARQAQAFSQQQQQQSLLASDPTGGGTPRPPAPPLADRMAVFKKGR